MTPQPITPDEAARHIEAASWRQEAYRMVRLWMNEQAVARWNAMAKGVGQ